MAQTKFIAKDGTEVHMDVNVQMYRRAAEMGISPRVLFNRMAEQAAESNGGVARQFGDAFEQAILAEGFIADAKLGQTPMTFGQIMNAELRSNTTRAPSGDDTTTAARVLYPQVILETVILNQNVMNDGFLGNFNSWMAETVNVTSSRVDQPIIDFKSSEDAPSGRGAQLSAPPTMMEITLGQTSHTIPTYGIGLMVSKEAMEAATLDLMAIAINRQSTGERIRMAHDQMNSIINGDADRNMAPLRARKFSEFDASNNGRFTKRGWLKMLRQDRFKYTRDTGLLTFDTACDMDDVLTAGIKQGPDAHKIQAPFNGLNMSMTNPKLFDLEDNILGSANRIVLFDKSCAMRRIVNVSAEYEAIEEMVMRKGTGFRIDHGEIVTRIFDEAILVVDVNV